MGFRVSLFLVLWFSCRWFVVIQGIYGPSPRGSQAYVGPRDLGRDVGIRAQGCFFAIFRVCVFQFYVWLGAWVSTFRFVRI